MSLERARPSVAIIGTRGYPSYYGGFETAVRYVAPYLVDAGWDVTVYGRPRWVDSSASPRDQRVQSVLTPGIERNSLSTLTFGFSASTHAAMKRPDVALVMNVANGYFLPALRARGIPTVVNVDGIEWQRDKWGRLARLMFRGGARLTSKWASTLVADSLAIRDIWSDEFGVDSTYIPYGGERSELPKEPPPDLPSRSYVLLVARLVPENSIGEFLDALEYMPSDRPVVIVGRAVAGSELDDKLRRAASRYPNLRLLGHISDDSLLHSLWAHAAAYFHGHSVGGTNPALVQAMALGARIVARDTVFNREVLAGSGMYTSVDPSHLAASLNNMIESPIDWGSQAMSRAEEAFSWEGVCRAYEEVLRASLR